MNNIFFNGNREDRKRGFFAIILVVSMIVGIIFSAPLQAKTSPLKSQYQEIRGVWLTNIDSDVLFNSDRLKNSLAKLRQFNFNTVYPTVWNWGYTLYPSKVAAKEIGIGLDPTPGLQKRDMLQEVINEGHKQKLTVIPWFEFGFMAPADSLLAKKHPEWLTSRSDGTTIVKEGTHDRVWLNPFHPQVQKFIQDLIVEIVSNYNIDGIQFDDHFGLPSELGYDFYTTNLYKLENQGKLPPKDSKDPQWVKWRADKITEYMKRIFAAIKKNNKNCIVSVAPNPQRFSYEYFLADWQKWERMGLIEDLVLQIYRDNLKVFTSELAYPEVKAAKQHIPVSIGILAGLKNRSVPMTQIQTQVEKVRSQKFAGISFFYYETLWNISKEKAQKRQQNWQKILK